MRRTPFKPKTLEEVQAKQAIKRISFDEHDIAHLYELALEHFCDKQNCGTCERIKGRIELFIGKSETKAIERLIKKNGYCNKLK